MTTHPNRSRRTDAPGRNPTPDEIRAARAAAGLSQREAAQLVHASTKGWEKWEQGQRRMHPGLWELFQRKTGSLPPPVVPLHEGA